VFFVCRVAQQEQHNKMSLENLAVVFGPTLLRPAAKVTHKTAMEQLVLQNNEALMQTSILMYYLSLKADNFHFVHQS
jgi:RhoGAP domain